MAENPGQRRARLRREAKALGIDLKSVGKVAPKSKPVAKPVPGVTGAAASGDDLNNLIGPESPPGAGEAFGRGLKEGGLRFAAGFGQLAIGLTDVKGEGNTRVFNESVEDVAQHIRGGKPVTEEQKVGKFVGEALPAAVIPPVTRIGGLATAFKRLPTPASTFSGDLTLGTGTGAAFGSTAFLEEGQERGNILLGSGALGAAGPIVKEVAVPVASAAANLLRGKLTADDLPETTKNFVKRKIASFLDDPTSIDKDTGRVIQDINKELETITKIPQSTGQQLQRQGILSIEAAASGSSEALALVARQAEKSLERMDSVMKLIRKKGLSETAIGTRAVQVLDDSVAKLKKVRSKQWDKDMASVTAASKGKGFVKADGLLDFVDTEIAKLPSKSNRKPGSRAAALAKELAEIRKTLVESGPQLLSASGQPLAARRAKKLDVTTVQANLSEWGEISRGNGNLFKSETVGKRDNRRIAGELKRRLELSLDAAEKDPNLGKLAVDLKTARANWRKGSEGIDKLKDSAIGQFLGGRLNDTTLAKTTSRILSMKPVNRRNTMKLIRKRDADLARAVERNFLETAVANSRVPDAPAGSVQFDPSKLLKELTKKNQAFMDIVQDGKGRVEIIRTLQALRVIKQRAVKAETAIGATQKVRESTGVAVGLGSGNAASLIFAGRQLASWAPETMARLIMTPEARVAMRILRERAPGEQRIVAAATRLQLLAKEFERADAEEANNEQK